MKCKSGSTWHAEWRAVRICSAMTRQRMRFRTPLLILLSIIVVATADVSGALLGPPARAAYRTLIAARDRQSTPAPSPAAPHRESTGQAQDDAVKLRHRSEITNPYHVEFHDVTSAAGIHFHHERASSPQRLYPETMGAGVGWIDYNQDGYLDAIFVNSGYTPYYHPLLPPQPALYRNNRDGTFTDVTEQSKIHSDGGFFFGVAVGDYDNDGFPDIYMTGYRHSVLWHNNGDGTFTDVTEKAGLLNTDGKSLAVVLADLNGDGWTDIFIANDTQRNFLYLNNGDGTFRDATYKSGAGFSEDGRPEAGMSADAADVMNNGLMYLFVSHLDFELNRMYRNNGDGTFTDYTIASGIGQTNILRSAFGARFFDFDNDGWRDLLVINGHILDNIPLYHPEVAYEEEKMLYRNRGDGNFVDATRTEGADFCKPRVGRGLAVGDYDNDGWQDFLVSNNGEDAQLFRNEGGSSPAAQGNHWVAVRLIGTKSNRDGIGASLKLTAGDLKLYDQAKGGMSYCSAQDPRIYFGLGKQEMVDSILIRWPSGYVQELKDIPADVIVTATEGVDAKAVKYRTPPER